MTLGVTMSNTPESATLSYPSTLCVIDPAKDQCKKHVKDGCSVSAGDARDDSDGLSTLCTPCVVCGSHRHFQIDKDIRCGKCNSLVFEDINGDLVSPLWVDYIEA